MQLERWLNWGLEGSPDFVREVGLRQVQIFRSQLLWNAVANVALSALVAIAIFRETNHGLLLGWLMLIWFGSARSFLSWFRHRGAPRPPSDLKRAQVRIVWTTIAAAGLWGAAAWVFFPEDNLVLQVVFTFVIGGMAAGVSGGLASMPLVWVGWTTATVVPTAGRFVIEGGQAPLVMAAMLATYAVVLLAFARNAFRAFKQSVRDRLTAASEAEGRVRAEAELERFFAQSNVLLAVADANGIFRKANPLWEKVFGYPAAELLARPFIELVHPSDFSRTQIELERLRQPGHRTQSLINRYRCKDGSYRWLQWNAVNDPVGPLVYISAVDVTDQQEIERVKEQFISTASHELRTPVTAIDASLKLLAASLEGRIPPESARMVQIAEKNSARLIRLVNDMLDLDRLQAGRMSFRTERIDLSMAVQEAVTEAAPLFEQADLVVDLRLQSGTFVMADPDRLHQIMANLLSNAAKFSPPSSRVEVSMETINGMATVAVRDRGAGIPQSFRTKVFEKFSQADLGAGARIGSGLGLSIAKQFVENMGGAIRFESPHDGGTRFVISLPQIGRTEDRSPLALSRKSIRSGD